MLNGGVNWLLGVFHDAMTPTTVHPIHGSPMTSDDRLIPSHFRPSFTAISDLPFEFIFLLVGIQIIRPQAETTTNLLVPLYPQLAHHPR